MNITSSEEKKGNCSNMSMFGRWPIQTGKSIPCPMTGWKTKLKHCQSDHFWCGGLPNLCFAPRHENLGPKDETSKAKNKRSKSWEHTFKSYGKIQDRGTTPKQRPSATIKSRTGNPLRNQFPDGINEQMFLVQIKIEDLLPWVIELTLWAVRSMNEHDLSSLDIDRIPLTHWQRQPWSRSWHCITWDNFVRKTNPWRGWAIHPWNLKPQKHLVSLTAKLRKHDRLE